MKIDYPHIAAIPSSHANAVQVMKTCAALARQGVDIQLFCPPGGMGAERARAVYGIATAFPIRFWTIGAVPFLSSLIFRLRSGFRMLTSSAVIYTRDIGTAFIASRLRHPFVYELHAVPHKPAQRFMCRQIIKSCSLVALASITRGVEEDFLAAFGGLAADRRAIIPCAADAPPPGFQSSASLTKTFTAGYVGHLYRGKGAALIWALAIQVSEVEFHIVGKIEDPALEGEIPDNIHCHGLLSHIDAMEQLRRFDVVLAPYQEDASAQGVVLSRWFSPLKIFEYMAYGKAILSSDLKVIREILEDGRNALLVKSDDVDAWATALRCLASDEDLRQALAAEALRDFARHYSYDRRAEKIIQLLHTRFATR